MCRLLLRSIITSLILISFFESHSQVPVFAIGIGGSTEDHAHRTTVDNNGNIIVTGRFTGTADFDPGTAVFNLTSNGSSDIFVAKYTGTGAFLWAFKAGGTDRDAGYGVAIDNADNIYITGYFRNTADFDPSAATANLVSNGHSGSDPGWSGDIFVAKYTTNGNYVWAFSVGGPTISDDGQEIIIDNQNNVIITGFFSGDVDFDPSPTSSFTMSGVGEEMFLAKYTGNGNLMWAKQMGTASITNETVRQLDVDGSGNIYITGFFSGTADFDPGPGIAQLNAGSLHEGFIASYSPSGDYGWAYQFGGTGFNQGWSIDVEGGAVYIAGVVQGASIRFTSANGTSTLGSVGGNDAFFAKYTLTGSLLYVNSLAGTGNEEAYDITASSTANCVYVAGIFQGTADFAPGTQTANLTSNGGGDAFVGRYTLDGSHLGAFNIGSGSEDFAFAVRFIGSDLLVNGSFMGSNVDFDPGSPTLPRTSAGNYDGFVARYTAPDPLSFDFNYKQDVCNPLSVQFFSLGNNLQSPYWGFSDGGSSTGNFTPVYTFPSFGNYTVKYSVTNGATRDTVTKIIPVNVVQDDIVLTPDTTICNGASKQLRTSPSLSFCWTPTTYLNNPNSPNPIASPPNDITYYFNAEVTGANVIVNGDFSAGNTGFISQYNYRTPNVTEGEYFVGPNPQTWNGGMSNCKDHTTGTGNMMLVNGAPVADVTVWSQTVSVTANTNYAFSTWLEPLHISNPAQLQFAINGKLAGNLIVATLPPCTWTQFYTTWNSGNNTTATISIVNKNQQIAGNDFALDDISFAPVFIKRDSVHITVDKPVIDATADTSFCPGGSAQLNTIGAATYSWSPTTGLSDASIANPVAAPIATTKYYVTGTTASGCTAKDSVTVTIKNKPNVVVTNDAAVCPGMPFQLQASGGTDYVWSPATGLSDANIANPVATNNADITYTVSVTGANTCTNTGSVKLTMRAKPLFTVSPATAVCDGKSTTLTASGGDSYLWSPASLLNDPTSRTPVATPAGNTTFSVYISESACNYDTTLTVNVSINPSPDVSAQKSNDIDCTTITSSLTATGAAQYLWTPSSGLDDPRKPNPIANIGTTTKFTVTGTNNFGCTGTDTVTVKVSNDGRPIFEVPNAFTPNGDRVNNCFGIRKWAQVNQMEFIIYNRWGQKVFSTNDPGKCWDGTLNGKPQDSGGYVYVIRAKSACGEVFRKGMVLLLR